MPTTTIAVPDIKLVQDLLWRLLPNTAKLQHDASPPPIKDVKGWVSLCRDDQGNFVAAVAADTLAGLEMGGGLLMLPANTLKDLAKTGEQHGGVMDALSEVFNNLTAAFNRVENNPHVACVFAEPIAQALGRPEGAWMAKAAARLDLVAPFLGARGRILLLTK